MAVNLGYVPQKLTVTLAEGGDFVSALVATTPWPVGTGIELRLTGGTVGTVTWPAVVDDVRADWNVSNLDVQDVIDAKASTARLVYTESDGTTIVWAEGSISVP